MNILHIDSCALGDRSPSRQHTAAIVAQLAHAHEVTSLKYRDLLAAPLTHVTGPLLQAMSKQWNAAIPMHPDLRAEVLLSAALLQEFTESDVVVVGAPMDNYFAPSALKVWLDRLLHLSDARDSACLAEVRVLLVTSERSDDGIAPRPMASHASLLRNYEEQLAAAFTCLGVRQLEFARNAEFADLP